jgi:hypothetical protein
LMITAPESSVCERPGFPNFADVATRASYAAGNALLYVEEAACVIPT